MQSGTPFETTAFGGYWIPALAPRAKPGSLGRNDSCGYTPQLSCPRRRASSNPPAMQSGTPFETTAFGDDWIPALAPRAKPGSLGRNDSGLRSEPHVGAGAKQVGVERHVAGRHEGAIEAAVEVAEIDVEVLGLHADIADDAELEAGADRPARRGDAAGREARQGGIDVADREAAGEIRQEPVQGIAEAAAHGRQPVVARRAAGRAQSRRRSPDVGPVDVAFDAERGLAELPIVADGAADQPARHVEPIDAVPLRAAPAAAAVDAEIEAG